MNMENLIYSMLTESTGAALCDSGDAYGRHWERNQKRTLTDFKNDPEVSFEYISKDEYNYEISVFHYLIKKLELDEVCEDFNSLKCKDWDSDIYGVSQKQQRWLEKKGFIVGDSWNTYNGESNLSQVLQGTNLELDGENYVLIQIHQGCDVRGGYTDAKLFKMSVEYLGEDVMGEVTKKSGKTISIDNMYDGRNLTDENGKMVNIAKTDKVSLYLLEN